VLIGSLIVLLLLAAHPGHTRARGPLSVPISPSAEPASPSHPSVSSLPRTVPPTLPRTDDPVRYAREAASALFDVDPEAVTREEFLQFWRGELPTVVYSDAAAKGLTLATQNSDAIENLTDSWIPPRDAWNSEAAERTTNRFVITSVSVPDYWINDVAAGIFRDPGLHMERVMGVLTQIYGIDPTDRQTSARSVVIDLGLLCGPTQPGGCRLLAPQQPPGAGDAAP
jgi:hypothetical protein